MFAAGAVNEGEGHVLASRLSAAHDVRDGAAASAGRPWSVAFSMGGAESELDDGLDALHVRADAALSARKLARR